MLDAKGRPQFAEVRIKKGVTCDGQSPQIVRLYRGYKSTVLVLLITQVTLPRYNILKEGKMIKTTLFNMVFIIGNPYERLVQRKTA